MARLIVRREGDRPRVIDLGGRGLSIGRSTASDVVLEDPETTVSRHHAEVRVEEGHYVVVDRGSRNGIWVSDTQVSRLALTDRTTFSVGCFDIEFRDGGGAAAEPAGPVGDTLPPPSGAPPPDAKAEGTEERMVPATSADLGELPRSATMSGARWGMRGRRLSPVASLGVGAVILGGVILGFLLTRGGDDAATGDVTPVASPTGADSRAKPAAGTTGERAATPAGEKDQAGQAAAPAPDPLAQKPLDASGREPSEGAQKPGEQAAAPVALKPTPRAGSRAAKRATVPADPWPLLDQLVDETPESQRTRSKMKYDRYQELEAMVSAGQFEKAVEALRAMVAEDPGYLSVADLDKRAQDGLAEKASQAMADCARLEKAGDLPAAMAECQRAKVLAPELDGLESAIAELKTRMEQEGNEAFQRARQFDALRQTREAASAYERVVALLPASDPKHITSQIRLKELRGRNP